MKDQWFKRNRPLVMAHRGDQELTPENTILSFENAVSLGVDVLETDVRMTFDKELVLFHDETLERTTNGSGKISEHSLEELRHLDLGYRFTLDDGKTHPFRGKGLRIVTLEEAFNKFPEVAFNLDIKDKDPRAPELLAQIIKEQNREESVIVASFHPEQVERFRRLMPAVHTAAHPIEVKRFMYAVTLRLHRLLVRTPPYGALQVPIEYKGKTIVTRKFVKVAHQKGIAVHVWTVNDQKMMEWLIDVGIDGIFTDKPALLIEILKDRGMM